MFQLLLPVILQDGLWRNDALIKITDRGHVKSRANAEILGLSMALAVSQAPNIRCSEARYWLFMVEGGKINANSFN